MTSSATVAIFTSSEGHFSIAQAAAQIVSHKYSTFTYAHRNKLFDGYSLLYKSAPQLFKIPYQLSNNRLGLNLGHQLSQHYYQPKITKFLQGRSFNLMINTYFMYNRVLEKISQQSNIPLINIITDPWTAHPILVSPTATVNLTFDQQFNPAFKKFFPQVNFQPIGWLVREEFSAISSPDIIRQQLNLRPQILTILITSGFEGTNLVTKILPMLVKTARPIQIVVACGKNETLYQNIVSLSETVKNQTQLHILPLAFTDQLHLYMQAADLIVGKAGPNTIFEAVATHTPFFAITHIAGQEDGNLDLIKHYQLGYVEEDLVKASQKLAAIIASPQQLQQFKAPIRELAKYNQLAKQKLLNLTDQLLDQQQ